MPASFIVKVIQRQWLSGEIMELTVEKPFDFLAGQYVFIEHEGERHPYSIASAPHSHTLSFHIQNSPRHPIHAGMWTLLENTAVLTLSLPEGQAYLRETSHRPLLLIAGGSGFAPIHSIIASILQTQSQRQILLYWGVQEASLFYDLKSIQLWQDQFPDFKWIPVLSKPDAEWTGRTGLVHHAVLEDQLDLAAYDIYIAGPFPLSYAAAEDFIRQGHHDLKIYSDALS